jgi:D-glycero-beta-D-manno-heptose 1-phosphate adenylyltransferase
MTLDQVRSAVEAQRARGRRIVLTNGAFDLLHVGHLRYLESAKALGDVLVVAVNSDASVRLAKGPSRPVVPQAERAELVAALRCVDLVLVFDEPDVKGVIQALKPDIHAKGTDYTVESVPERAEVEAYGGRVVIAGDPKDHSTSALAARLKTSG